jgi:hypothetical protein
MIILIIVKEVNYMIGRLFKMEITLNIFTFIFIIMGSVAFSLLVFAILAAGGNTKSEEEIINYKKE